MKHFPSSRHHPRLEGLSVEHAESPVTLKRLHAVAVAAVLFVAGIFTGAVLFDVIVFYGR